MQKFELYQDKGGKFRFRLLATNGQIMLKSQSYTTIQSAKKGIRSIINAAKDNGKFIRKNSQNGRHYFNIKSQNGEIIGTSIPFSSTGGLELGIRSVMLNAPSATVSV